MLPTVGQEARPVVVSLSPHLVETHSSLTGAFLALQLGRPVDEFLGLARGGGDGLDVAVLLDREAGDRLAGLRRCRRRCRWVQPGSMPITTHGGDVRVGAGADHGAEMQLEILAELQPAIGVRQRHRALDVVGDRLAGGVGDVVDRQDDDVVADADAAVLAAPGPERVLLGASCRHGSYHRLVLQVVDVDVVARLGGGRPSCRCPRRT